MKKKYLLLISFIFLIIVIIFIFFDLIRINLKPSSKNLNNPNLLSFSKIYKYPEGASKKFEKFLLDNDLKETFKINNLINYFYPKERWLGRISYREVSRQAVFGIDNSQIEIPLRNLPGKKLRFAIFNSKNSSLIYQIFLKDKQSKKILFNQQCSGELLIWKTLQIPQVSQDGLSLIFSTRGRGVGAWINPCFIKDNLNPKIFILIMLDTLRSDHTSLYGYSKNTTPQIDTLAKDSMVYYNTYSSSNWTLPAHVSLFTGKDLIQHQVATPSNQISTQYPLIAELFQKRGFTTVAFTGGGFVQDSYGFHRGFQVYSNRPGQVFHINSAQLVLNHFKKYISEYKGNDLFVFLHTYQIHAPYKAPPKYIKELNPDLKINLQSIDNFLKNKKTAYFKSIPDPDKQKLIDLYDSAIYYADQVLVGGIVKYLKSLDQYHNSMIMVTSDHGEEFYDHGSWEHGHSLYNEIIKIPLIVKYPSNKWTGDNHQLMSIANIPNLILNGLGHEEYLNYFKFQKPSDQPLLPIIFPVSPTIKNIPAKISFVNSKYQFIYNIYKPSQIQFFNPQPKIVKFELYELTDSPQIYNIYKKNLKVNRNFLNLLREYKKKLSNLKGTKKKLGNKLKKELKSLGYLND